VGHPLLASPLKGEEKGGVLDKVEQEKHKEVNYLISKMVLSWPSFGSKLYQNPRGRPTGF
jgi:hypothetical protein